MRIGHFSLPIRQQTTASEPLLNHGMSNSSNHLERLVNLLASATDPSVDRPLSERKRLLFEGVATLIGADAWVWATAECDNANSNQSTLIMMDGGWKDERERIQVLGILVQPRFQPTCLEEIQVAIRQRACITRSRPDLLDDAIWIDSQTAKLWRVAGYDEFVMSVLPAGDSYFNWVGFHRQIGRPPFVEEQKAIVHAIFSQVPWICASQHLPTACDNMGKLSPRERQVLFLLLGGDSRKQVASKLELSPHTVSDHLKMIYRKLGVVTRAELLARFISGTGSPAE